MIFSIPNVSCNHFIFAFDPQKRENAEQVHSISLPSNDKHCWALFKNTQAIFLLILATVAPETTGNAIARQHIVRRLRYLDLYLPCLAQRVAHSKSKAIT